MSRRSRKPPRRERFRSKETVQEAPARPVRVSVVTAPETASDGHSTLGGDVRLVKAALLYADSVELLGPAASLVHAVGLSPGASQPSLAEIMRWTELLSPDTNVSPEVRRLLPHIEKLAKSGRRTGDPEADAGIDQTKEFLDSIPTKLGPVQDEIVTMVDGDELRPALSAGLVEVADLGVGFESLIRSHMGKSSGQDDAIALWFEQVKTRLTDSTKRLLFDDTSADIIESAIREGTIAPGKRSLRQAGKAALGTGLIARLPAFPEAKMDELLNLRSDLQGPLVRYRAAVSKMSAHLPDSVGSEVGQAVDDLWESEAAPALTELDELLYEHGLVRELAKQARQDVRALVLRASTFYVALGAATDLDKAISAVAAVVPDAAGLLGKAWQARADTRALARSNELFYLYEANRRLT